MDKFLLKVCNKDTKIKSLGHSISAFIANLEQVSVQRTSHDSYVTPFLNRNIIPRKIFPSDIEKVSK